MSDMLLSFHEKRWNEKEIKWLAHLKSRILQPSPNDGQYNRDMVEKCPSYFSGKLLMKFGKEKMYDTLHTMVNEFGQIVQQKFLNGDNHDELEENLLHLNSLGLDPSLVFSDNPERDRSMLQRVFPKLSNGINEEAFKKHVQKLVQVETRSY